MKRQVRKRWDLVLAIAVCAAFSPFPALAQGWQPAPSLPVTSPPGRVWATGLNVDGTLVAMGGTPWIGGDQDGSVHSLVSDYTGAWVAEIPLEGLGPIVSQGAGVDDLGRMIVFGGVSAIDPEEPGQEKAYDFIEGPNLSIAARGASAPMTYFAVATDDTGRVYSIGGGPGASATAGNPNSGYAERYVGSTDTWEVVAPMPAGVADAAAVYDGLGHILVLGGFAESGGARTANVARYDIATDSWSDTAVPDMPEALSGLRAVLGDNGLVYALGGSLAGSSAESAVWVLDPDANVWSAGPGMITPRQHFAVVLGDDSHIYAIGGESSGIGTELVEKLYTPLCPNVAGATPYLQAWPGQRIVLNAAAAGGAPMTFQWRKDGVPLTDGPSGSGSTISGAQTTSLVIADADAPDAGSYDMIATNDCGSSTSAPSVVAFRIPPLVVGSWEVVNLHPAWAESSHATGVEEHDQVGYGTRDIPDYNNIDLSCEWKDDASYYVTYAGPGSVGGAFYQRAAGLRVGWWWWPYQCYIGGQWYTCYSKQGSMVDADDTFTNLQVSGWEYGSAYATDGREIVGAITTDDEVGNVYAAAVRWKRNAVGNWTYTPLSTPYGSEGRQAGAHAVYGGKEYGSWSYRGVQFDGYHACMWSGTQASLVGMEPPGSTSSGISAAHVGQQGGSATFAGSSHAVLWSGDAQSAVDVHPAGSATSSISDIHTGIQVGTSDNRAGIWRGSADSFVDLHAFLPASFLSSSAADVYVDLRGAISVVGSGYNSDTARTEALLWRLPPQTPECATEEIACEDGEDGDCDGLVDCLDPDCCGAVACAGADLDADGHELCDCASGDPSLWTTPDEAGTLLLAGGPDGTILEWTGSAAPGADSVGYDVLRSSRPADFLTATVCLDDADPQDTVAADPGTPSSGATWFYLVRAVNGCEQGAGSLGRGSDNVVRSGRFCH